MKLSLKEFEMVNRKQYNWIQTTIGSRVYNTLTTSLETKLFWFDFLQFVFAPYFKEQRSITTLGAINLSEKVLMDNNLNVLLPPTLESVIYYGSNLYPPFKLDTKISMNVTTTFFSILIIALLIVRLITDSRS